MADQFKEEVEDLCWEHSQHKSNLGRKCSECFKQIDIISNNVYERNQEALERLDYSFKNPLE